jgi:DNA-binding transcriptional regulator YdaS (Cro superfamily)
MSDTQIDAVRRAVHVIGSQAALARALSVTPVTVGQWLKPDDKTGRHVPPKQCVRIEKLTGGKVSRRDLRPDDWLELWPELQRGPLGSDRRATDKPSTYANTDIDRRAPAEGVN